MYSDNRNSDLQVYIDGLNFILNNVKSTEQYNYLKIANIRLRGEIRAAVSSSKLDTWNDLQDFLRSGTNKQWSESFFEDQLISMKQKHGKTIQHYADSIEKIGHKLIIDLFKSG